MEIDLGHSADRDEYSFKETFDLAVGEDGFLRCDVVVSGTTSRLGSRYYLEATVAARLTAPCSRCLKEYKHPIDAGFKLVLQRGAHHAPPESVAEDDYVQLDERTEYAYDIFPRVREAIVIELPIRYLCDEECRGLCPQCGADLNEGDCGCDRTEADPRWDGLRKLLKPEDES